MTFLWYNSKYLLEITCNIQYYYHSFQRIGTLEPAVSDDGSLHRHGLYGRTRPLPPAAHRQLERGLVLPLPDGEVAGVHTAAGVVVVVAVAVVAAPRQQLRHAVHAQQTRRGAETAAAARRAPAAAGEGDGLHGAVPVDRYLELYVRVDIVRYR